MSRVPIAWRAFVAAALVLMNGCGGAGISTTPSAPPSATTAPSERPQSATPSPSADEETRDESSAGVVFEPEGRSLAGIPSAGQPAPYGPIIEPNITVISGGPTDAGAETIEEITSLSFEGVDDFWSASWEDGYPTIFYEPPSGFELYDSSTSDVPDSTCAESVDDPSIWAVNAFYCYGDRVIAYDSVLANDELSRIGDFAIVGTMAHEWGHHLQNLISTQPSAADTPTFSIEAELQADCLAGIYVAGAEETGTFPVTVDDATEAAEGFYDSGSNAGYGWFEPGFHGTKDERYAAFVVGYQATEIRACDAFATYMLDRTVSDGPYAIGYLEGASATFTADEAYEITGAPYADVRLVADAVTVTSQNFDGSLTEALASYAPDAAGDVTALSVLGEAHDYTETVQSWGIPGMTVGFFYSYDGPGDPRHGYITVHLSPTEHVLILDTSLPGQGTAESYAKVMEIAEIAIMSFQAPGL